MLPHTCIFCCCIVSCTMQHKPFANVQDALDSWLQIAFQMLINTLLHFCKRESFNSTLFVMKNNDCLGNDFRFSWNNENLSSYVLRWILFQNICLPASVVVAFVYAFWTLTSPQCLLQRNKAVFCMVYRLWSIFDNLYTMTQMPTGSEGAHPNFQYDRSVDSMLWSISSKVEIVRKQIVFYVTNCPSAFKNTAVINCQLETLIESRCTQ